LSNQLPFSFHLIQKHEKAQVKLKGVPVHSALVLAKAATSKSQKQAPKGYPRVHE
jgi:hypothetical protein